MGSKDIEIRNVSHSLLHSVSRKNAKFSRNKKGENFTKNNAKIFSQKMEIMHIKRKFREKCRIFKTNCKMLAKKLRKFIKKSLKFEDTRLTFKAQLMD